MLAALTGAARRSPARQRPPQSEAAHGLGNVWIEIELSLFQPFRRRRPLLRILQMAQILLRPPEDKAKFLHSLTQPGRTDANTCFNFHMIPQSTRCPNHEHIVMRARILVDQLFQPLPICRISLWRAPRLGAIAQRLNASCAIKIPPSIYGSATDDKLLGNIRRLFAKMQLTNSRAAQGHLCSIIVMHSSFKSLHLNFGQVVPRFSLHSASISTFQLLTCTY